MCLLGLGIVLGGFYIHCLSVTGVCVVLGLSLEGYASFERHKSLIALRAILLLFECHKCLIGRWILMGGLSLDLTQFFVCSKWSKLKFINC